MLLESLRPSTETGLRMHSRFVASALLIVALAMGGCGRAPYMRAEPLHFSPSAPPRMTFEALVRRADDLGYVIHDVDPVHGIFFVHARSVGNPSRSARRSNLFVVEVADREVRVSAIGRNVRRDGRMHPQLADELLEFGEAMQIASDSLRGGVAGAPAVPPRSYHDAPPSPEPPRAYSPPPPSRALGAPDGSVGSSSRENVGP